MQGAGVHTFLCDVCGQLWRLLSPRWHAARDASLREPAATPTSTTPATPSCPRRGLPESPPTACIRDLPKWGSQPWRPRLLAAKGLVRPPYRNQVAITGGLQSPHAELRLVRLLQAERRGIHPTTLGLSIRITTKINWTSHYAIM